MSDNTAVVIILVLASLVLLGALTYRSAKETTYANCVVQCMDNENRKSEECESACQAR